MKLAQGIQLADNPFHDCWLDVERWAAQEELTVEMRVELGSHKAMTVYHLVARHR